MTVSICCSNPRLLVLTFRYRCVALWKQRCSSLVRALQVSTLIGSSAWTTDMLVCVEFHRLLDLDPEREKSKEVLT